MKRVLKKAKGLALFSILVILSCGKASTKESSNASSDTTFTGDTVSAKSDSGGVLTATVDTSSKKTQIVKASSSSSISGCKAAFPSNSLNIPTDVSIQEVDSLASDNTAVDFGITEASTLSAASKAILISSNPSVSPSGPFTLQIPISTSLSLTSFNGYVLYKIDSGDATNPYKVGILGSSNIQVGEGVVNLTISHFGVYQLINSPTNLSLFSEVNVSSPPISLANMFPQTGTWKSSCLACRNNVPTCYEIDTFTASGSSISVTVSHYTDSSCSLRGDDSKAYSTYKVGSSVSTPSGATAVDVYATKYIVTPTILGASILNNQKFCGLSDWTASTPKNITGLACDSSNPDGVKARTFFSTFSISGSTLLLGKTAQSGVDDGTTEAKRMVGTDSVYPLTKQ